MALNARDAFSSALSLFSSLYEDMNPADLPEGLSPDCQDVWFLPGSVSTRPALSRYLNTAVAGTPQILSVEDYPIPAGGHVGIFLDANGAVWQRNSDGTKTQLTTVNGAGLQFKAQNGFDKQFYAYYNATIAAKFSASPFVGVDVPRYFDGTNFWRVTQDAPGAPPTISTVAVPSATIQGVGVPVTVNIVAGPNGIIWQDPFFYPYGGGAYWYRDFKVVTSTPHGLTSGQVVTISGSTSTPSVNGSWVAQVIDATSFAVGHNVPVAGAANGGGGTVGQASGSGTSLSRSNNQVVAVTSAAHGFKAGWQVQIAGIANTNIGGGISSIARDANGVVTVVTSSAHGLSVGMSCAITGVTDTSFDGTFTVVTVISSTSFTYQLAGSVATSSAGNVQDIWIGKFIITSVPSTTSFTYFQLGPNDTTSATGTATIVPLMAAGPRSAVVMFKSVNGAITAPSIPVLFTADGVNLISAGNIPIGPDGTAQRIVAFTPAFGANFYYLTPSFVPTSAGQPEIFQPGTIINDNTTTSVILDFADTALTNGTQIDTTGNDLFAQIVLAPCLGVVEYQGRLIWWGEINNLKNLINMGFDGGYTLSSVTNRAGSGANDGGAGTAWTNPGNVTSASSYADVSLTGTGSSQYDLGEAFGFTVTGTLGNITVSFETYGVITGAGTLLYTIQLLKAGVPFGTPQTLIMPASAGSSGTPLNFSTTFASAGLTASDINNAAFGAQVKVQIIEVSSTATCHIRNLQIAVVTPNLQPLGWTQNLPTGGALGYGIVVDTGNMGFAYQMTSAGGATDCLITQGFYQDYYGASIPIAGRQYLSRMLAKTSDPTAAGNLVIEIGSNGPGQQLYVAKIPINTLGTSFAWVSHAISALPAVPDPTWLLCVYLENVPVNTVVTIDELSIVDSLKPVLGQQLRASYVGNEFGYDQNTGSIDISGYSTGLITACFEQRGVLYALTEQSRGDMIRIQNNGSTEPFEWPLDRFAQQVDCAGPGAIDVGEGVAWWAGQSGLRIFSGDQPKKLSQERQPTWNRINWAGTLSLWVKNDPIQRILYVGLPLDANTIVSELEPMSYRSVNTALEPADPLHISFSGKLICSDLCRKWTRWNLAPNCAAMLTNGATSQMVLGAGHGQLYSLSFSKFTDDDYGTIASYYTTYFHWNHEMEQNVPQLGLHRKIYAYLTAYVTGIGNLTITPLVDALANPWQPKSSVWNAITGLWESGANASPISEELSGQLDHDLDFRLNVLGDRVAFKIAVTPLANTTDAYMNLEHLVVSGRMDRVMPVRGAFI